MRIRWTLALLLSAVAMPVAHADTTIVDDDFESYNNDTELQAVWQPRIGSGSAPPFNLDDGILTSDDTLFPGIEGQGVDHLGGSVMQHADVTPASPLIPSATQSIHVRGDIFVGNDGNSRMSIGLRNRTSTTNLFEMGTYNSNGQTSDPTDPDDETGVIPVTTYAYRLILFDGIDGDLVENPDWQFFQFDTALDIDDRDPLTTEPTPDGIVGPEDIGAGWHTYSATITETNITLEIDLYRDGLDNGATLTAGSDVAGVDASVTWDVLANTTGFDSFRIGAPSGIPSANGVAFDNVSLMLLDVMTGGGTDADNDGDVDGADFLALQRDDPSLIAQWQTDYPVSASLSASAIPEPTSIAMLLFASAGLLTSRRR